MAANLQVKTVIKEEKLREAFSFYDIVYNPETNSRDRIKTGR